MSEVTRQLATLARAGIPVVEAIGAISEQLENNNAFKKVHVRGEAQASANGLDARQRAEEAPEGLLRST